MYLLIGLMLALFLFPFFWMVSVAIKPPDEVFGFPPRFMPQHPTLDNFGKALNPVFLRHGFNSVLVATLTTVVTNIFAVLAA
jgi:ABC-type glycerol-3-phosphate transport system permease component